MNEPYARDGNKKSGGGCFTTCLKILFCPLILPYYAVTIYLFPCLGTYIGRGLRGLFSCCFCDCCRYTDDEMPAKPQSLGTGDVGKDNSAIWVRMPEIDTGKEWSLFSKKIEPSDVGQGNLGDCWLMAQIAVLATRPEMVRRMFITQEKSVRGKYQIRFYHEAKKGYIIVTVDDYVPCSATGIKPVGERGGTAKADTTYSPLFAQPQGPEMWVMLLEKAYAKAFHDKQYGKLHGGVMGPAMVAFTGGSSLSFINHFNGKWSVGRGCSPSQNKTVPAREMFFILLAYVKHGALITASCTSSTNGLHGSHAYSILDAKDVSLSFFGGQRVQLLRLRNPWGSGEWQGAWSDSDKLWKEHAGIKSEVGYVNSNDGAFFIELSDFEKYFRSIQIVEYDQGIDSFRLDIREDQTCGTACGCLSGCCTFWVACKGCAAVYCPEEPSEELRPPEKRQKCCGCCNV